MQLFQPGLFGKKVLVVGLGRSGVAAARLCAARGAQVTVTDKQPAEALTAALAQLPPAAKREVGGHRAETFLAADLIVLSPGVPALPEVEAARKRGATVTGELELASWFVDAPIVAITGTNGKSTTTTLCGAMLAANGRPTFVGGNLGVPLAEAVGTPATEQGGACVLEVSSFQLETVESFRPQVAVLLNITPDHLDRHPTLEAYAAAKARIFSAQTPADFAVVNIDDPLVETAAKGIRSHCVPISTRRALVVGGWIEGDALCVRLAGGPAEYYPAHLPGLVGRHNLENALAALVAARLAGALPAEARHALVTFRPLAHRMELVGELEGVLFYDDSKGTNVGAVVAALDRFPRPVVLIAGGRDKGASYEPLAKVMKQAGRGAVLIGEAAPKLREVLAPVVPVEIAGSMEDAVAQAATMARSGDAVLLSPACSSFDMFRNYEHRAEVYRAAVRDLINHRSGEWGGLPEKTP
jgi:UDP-N-acetylmuramoylalanine--D-glutamate ligase